VLAAPSTLVSELMSTDVHMVTTDTDREEAARLVREVGAIALPVVDSEQRLVGVLTVDDAMRILETEETEDFALHGGHSPLRKPYLAVSAPSLARARAVWLMVLIVAAGLTVTVLDRFEGTLAIDTRSRCSSPCSSAPAATPAPRLRTRSSAPWPSARCASATFPSSCGARPGWA
jgi:Mg/Co/Ni transporter MgtE